MAVVGQPIAPVLEFFGATRDIACIESCKRRKNRAVKSVQNDGRQDESGNGDWKIDVIEGD